MRDASFPWHKLKDALLQRVDVTQSLALDKGWGWRLSARIYELKKRDWPIQVHYDHNRFAHYYLPKGWKPMNEKTPAATGARYKKQQSINTGGRVGD